MSRFDVFQSHSLTFDTKPQLNVLHVANLFAFIAPDKYLPQWIDLFSICDSLELSQFLFFFLLWLLLLVVQLLFTFLQWNCRSCTVCLLLPSIQLDCDGDFCSCYRRRCLIRTRTWTTQQPHKTKQLNKLVGQFAIIVVWQLFRVNRSFLILHKSLTGN